MRKGAVAICFAVLMAAGAAFAAPAVDDVGTQGQQTQMQTGVDQQQQQAMDLSAIRGEQARKLQQSLKDQGFYEGKIDGILGARTKEALRKFQESKGFQASGKIDQQTASALGIELSQIQPVRGTEPESLEPVASPTPGGESGMDTQNQSGTSGSGAEVETQTQSGTSETGADHQTQTDTQSGTETGDAASTGEIGTQSGGAMDQPDDRSGEASDQATGTGSMNTGADVDAQAGTSSSSDLEKQAGTNLSADQIKQVQKKLSAQGYFTGKPTGTVDEETKNAVRKFQRAQGLPETGSLDVTTCEKLGVKLDTNIQHQSGSEIDTQTQTDVQRDTETNIDRGVENQSGSDVQHQSGSLEDDAKDIQSGDDSTSAVTGGDTATTETEATSGQRHGGEAPMGGAEMQQDPNVVDESEIEPQAGTTTTFDKKTIRKVEQALKDKKIFDGKPDGILDAKTTAAIRRFQEQNSLTVTGQLDVATLNALGIERQSGNVNEDLNKVPASGNETPAATPMETPGGPTGTPMPQ